MRAPILAKLSISFAVILAAGCGDSFVASSGSGGTGGQASTGGTGGGGTGGSSAGGTGGGAMCASIDLASAACNTCLEKSCATPYCACSNAPDCAALVDCVNKLGPNPSGEGYQTCLSQRPNSISLVGRIESCGTTSCPVCGFKETKCSGCLYDHCPKDVNACYSNPKCVGFIECSQACNGDAICQANCSTGEFASGQQSATALQMCAALNCGGACPPPK